MEAPQPLTDLLKQAQAGDASALDTIFLRYADPLFRYLYAHSGEVELAEEIAARTWVRVVERLATFQVRAVERGTPERAFSAWLYRIGYNLLMDVYRRSRHAPLPLVDSLVQDEVRVEAPVLAAEARQEVQTALLQLTPEQREVVLLRVVEGWSIAEVGRFTGRTEGAVKALQHRALARLARLLTALQ